MPGRALIAACCLVCLGQAPAQAQNFPPIWQTWISSLPGQGYSLIQGSAGEVAPARNAGAVGDTQQPNPRYSYIEPYVPIGAEYVDPIYGAPLTTTTAAGVQVNPYYHLATNEALVTIVCLPPLAAYFSFQTNMYTRPANLYAQPQLLSPDPARAEIFGSVNNGINNVAILRQSGLGFGQGAVAFITTSNPAMAKRLVASFTAEGGSSALMFVDPLGANINPGLDASGDDLVSLFRTSVAEDYDATEQWGLDAAENILVYRIDQPAGDGKPRFGSIAYYNKLSNAAESTHASDLKELAGILQNWLLAQQGSATIATTVSSEKVSSTGALLSGAFGGYCIQNGTNCGGDEQDSDAYKTANIGMLPAGHLFFVAGVDHTVTNNATFVGLNIQGNTVPGYVAVAEQTNPAAAGFTAGSLTGSAAAVLQNLGLMAQASPALMADLPNLYVQIFTRPCSQSQSYCVQPFTTVLTSGALPFADLVKVSERAYVLPGQLNGASPAVLLNPDVIY
jgi:hypothetical protein